MTPPQIIDFSKIDYDDPRITPLDELAIRRMLAKRDQYLFQSRDLEARGAGAAIFILWQTLLEAEPPGTINGELNG